MGTAVLAASPRKMTELIWLESSFKEKYSKSVLQQFREQERNKEGLLMMIGITLFSERSSQRKYSVIKFTQSTGSAKHFFSILLFSSYYILLSSVLSMYTSYSFLSWYLFAYRLLLLSSLSSSYFVPSFVSIIGLSSLLLSYLMFFFLNRSICFIKISKYWIW